MDGTPGVYIISGDQMAGRPGLRETIERDGLPGERHRRLLTDQGMDLSPGARYYSWWIVTGSGPALLFTNAETGAEAYAQFTAYIEAANKAVREEPS